MSACIVQLFQQRARIGAEFVDLGVGGSSFKNLQTCKENLIPTKTHVVPLVS